MKQYYTIILILVVSTIANAQVYEANKFDLNGLSIGKSINPSSFISTSNFTKSTANKTQAGGDTLTDAWDRKKGTAVYGFNSNGQTLPLTGSNNIFFWLGEKFPNSSNVTINGLLVAFFMKNISAEPDSMDVIIYNLGENQAPSGQPIYASHFMTDAIDTSTSEAIFTYIPIGNNDVFTSQGFVTYIQTYTGVVGFDFLAVYSTLQGDGAGENRACLLTVQNNQLVAANFSNLNLQMQDGNPPNFDIAILPVVNTGTGVDDPSINGLTLRSVSPNPSHELAMVNFAIDQSSDVTISILSSNGRELFSTCNGLSAGEHSIPIDLNSLASGNYFVSIKTAKARLATKLSVVK